ncbi:7029_t:CDS:2 [Entrophospora sp. SA101]|nr:7029_t:CDS:2 [Entrophospora sp. SA101]
MSIYYLFGPNKIRSSEVFLKSNLCYGFVNLKPILPIHNLLLNNRCISGTISSSPKVCDIMISAQKIGKVIEKEYKSDSLTIAIQDGPAAGQTVSHCHVHIIPRKLEAEYLGKFFIDENSN